MDQTFDVQLSKQEYVIGLDALSSELAKLDPTRNRMMFQRLAAVVVLLLATGWFFPEAMAGLLFIIIGFAIFDGVMAKFWIKSAHGVSYDPKVGSQRLQFTDTAILESSERRERQWSWDAVRRVHDRPAALVFELVGWDMLVLPSRLWSSAEQRQSFIESIRERITRPVGEPISVLPSPTPARHDLFHMAAIGAFVDVCLIVMFVLPVYRAEFASIAETIGRTGLLVVTLLVSAGLGYAAYRVAWVGLPRLNARSPAAATVVSQVLIWAFVTWLGATQLGWI
jgi:hypothetical protein